MIHGGLLKMKTKYSDPVEYTLAMTTGEYPLNQWLGKNISLEFLGEILCQNCGSKTKKSFSQGYCFPCSQRLASCDMCMVRPETCHFHQGTCREPKWGEKHCFIPHTIYLANSSGVKVGITRELQSSTRWMDQGAIQALRIGEVNSRLDSGKVESALKKYVSDKTNWRKMLKGETENIDLKEKRKELLKYWPEDVDGSPLWDEEVVSITYPVLKHPEKVVSHNLDKKPLLTGVLQGIKAQYLILDTAVINIRKYIGYQVQIKLDQA